MRKRLTISPCSSVCQIYKNDQPSRTGSFQCPWKSQVSLVEGRKKAFSKKPKMLEFIHSQCIGQSRWWQGWGGKWELKHKVSTRWGRKGQSVQVKGKCPFCLVNREYISWTRLVIVFQCSKSLTECARQCLFSKQNTGGCHELWKKAVGAELV